MIKTDILISGGGIAGLSAAAAFGKSGFRTILIDPSLPVSDGFADGTDLRSTAFLQPARAFLAGAGLWERLSSHATPLRVMRIVDAGGQFPEPRVVRDFVATDLGNETFGWNFPNWLLRREMTEYLEGIPSLTFMRGVGLKGLLLRKAESRVTLTDGQMVFSRLVIAADGRDSATRQAAGIGVRRRRYGQKALVFAVTHPEAHNNISSEVHRSGGPFTLVPLPDYEGRHCSAVVWMEDGPEAMRLAALSEADFEAEATTRSVGLLGPLSLASRRQVWPIISQIADRLSAQRVALVAEAAHVIPPIGAQGLNMSLRDLSTLLHLACSEPDAVGGEEMLDTYARSRHPEILLRVAGIDALNKASQARLPLLRDLRAAGLRLLHDIGPVRRGLMQMGLGARSAYRDLE